MATEKSTKMQLAVFCILFMILLAVTKCNGDILGGSASSKNNVVDKLTVRGYYDHLKDSRPNQEDKILLCSKECTPSLPCWCCDRRGRTSQCFPNANDCNRYCA